MLKEIFLKKRGMQSKTVHNAIITLGDIDDSGKGKRFKSRFIQPGLAGYPGQYGNVLVRKETLDKSLKTIIGAPVIINHKDITKDNANDERVGVISNAWYSEKDGWYWCEGVIWNETAQNLITDKNWSVSCSYDYLEENDEGGSENNIPYDREFTKLNFVHLALVDNPRYERASIVFNSKTFREEDHPRDERGRFRDSNEINPNYKEELKQVIEKAKNNPNERQKLVIGKVSKDLEQKAKENGFDISGYEHDIDVSGTRHVYKEHGNLKTEEPRGQIPITDKDFEKIPSVIYAYDDVNFSGKNKIGRETITYKKAFDDGTIMYVEEIRDKRKTLSINTLYKYKNTDNPRTFVENNNPLSNVSINNADNSCTFTDFNPQRPEYTSTIIISNFAPKFNPNITNHKQNKEKDMVLIEELKKLINKVENSKEEEVDKDKEKEVNNEDVDKREILREADAIAMKPVSEFKGGAEEKFRTLTKKLEQLSYNKSSSGAADNSDDSKDDDKNADNKKIKNESEKSKYEVEDLKGIAGAKSTTAKDLERDVENKCKNSVVNSKPNFFDRINEVYNSANNPPKEHNDYVSRSDRLKAAEEYFAK